MDPRQPSCVPGQVGLSAPRGSMWWWLATHPTTLTPPVVEIEPDQYSPAAFWAFLDEMLAHPEPTLESIGAAPGRDSGTPRPRTTP
jgi:hypothetical protein